MIESAKGDIDQQVILNAFYAIATGIEAMHSFGQIHRDIKLQNVLISKAGQYKLCDFGSSTDKIIKQVNKSNRATVQQEIEKNTTPIYRSPEQLDLYSGFEIGPKVDIFALGCLIFMLCFKKQPFEMRLSAINNHYFMPEKSIYSEQLKELIRKCFTPNPAKRPSAVELASMLKPLLSTAVSSIKKNENKYVINVDKEIEKVQEQFKLWKGSHIQKEPLKGSFLGKMRKAFTQMTAKTEYWIENFIEESEESPPLKYNRNIISKCWEKRYKVDKVYTIMMAETVKNMNKCLVIVKILILLHNFLRKGPKQAILGCGVNNNNASALQICLAIYGNWKLMNPSDRSQDVKRDLFISLIIQHYALVLVAKIRVCDMYACFIQGNYCPLPYFLNSADKKILSVKFIEELLAVLEKFIGFHKKVQQMTSMENIQKTILLSVIDEEYCLVSFLVHLYSTFKESTSYIEGVNIDEVALVTKVAELDDRVAEAYGRFMKMVGEDEKRCGLEKNMFKLQPEVINHIKGLKVLDKSGKKGATFDIRKYLAFDKALYGLMIPDTYEGVVNTATIEQIQKGGYAGKGQTFFQVGNFKRASVEVKQPVIEKQITQRKKVEKEGFFCTDNPFMERQSRETKVGFDNFMQQADIMQFSHQHLNKDFTASRVLQQPISKSSSTIAEYFAGNMEVSDLIKFEEIGNSQIQGKEELEDEKCQLIRFQEEQSVKEVKQLPLEEIFNQTPSRKSKSKELDQISSFGMQQLNLIYNTSLSPRDNMKGFIMSEVSKNANQFLIDFRELEFVRNIGSGTSSEVYLGNWRGQQVAIKKIRLASPQFLKEFQRQVMTCVKIRPHPHLATMIGASQNSQTQEMYIISEYCHGGNLFELLHQSKVPISWPAKVSIAKQIAKGMLFLHSNNLPTIHRDLKSLNILLTQPYRSQADRIRIKIADFGLSRELAEGFMTGSLGTFHWMAPEIFNNKPYSTKADVYSYAIVLWQILTRRLPYKEIDNPQAIMKYVTVDNGRPETLFITSKCPPLMKQLMIRCWDAEPDRRPDFKEILHLLGKIQFH